MKNILLLGDVCPTPDTESLFESGNYAELFGDLTPIIAASHSTVINLEYAVTTYSIPTKKCGPILKGGINSLKTINKAGIGYASLANNHIGDYGKKGIIDTINACDSVGIKHFGAGSEDERSELCLIEVEDVKIGVISFAEEEFNSFKGVGANVFDPYISLDLIVESKRRCDYLIVLNHGGIEYYRYPSPALQKKCRKMVEKGADLVLCQHSHCVGTFENYLDGQIVYGQGNTVYGYRKNSPMWNEGLAIKVIVKENSITTDYQPFRWTPEGVKIDKECSVIMDDFKARSEAIQDNEFVQKKWQSFCEKKSSHYLPLLFGLGVNLNRINRVLNNFIVNTLYSSKQRMVSMNLIRCESHHEVTQTILEVDFKKKQ